MFHWSSQNVSLPSNPTVRFMGPFRESLFLDLTSNYFKITGMNYEGIYRKTGGMTQTKLITQCFERGADFDLDDLDRFNDLAAVTSCMKNYFRSLPDPLFTHDLHEQFVSCAG